MNQLAFIYDLHAVFQYLHIIDKTTIKYMIFIACINKCINAKFPFGFEIDTETG
jgi:hypothetical protein